MHLLLSLSWSVLFPNLFILKICDLLEVIPAAEISSLPDTVGFLQLLFSVHVFS